MVDFSVQCSPPRAGQCVMHVAGEVDFEHATDLGRAGRVAFGNDGAVRTLVVDLSKVTFMDSTGVGALIDIHAAAMVAGVSLSIRDAPPVVIKVLQITGLAPMFRVEHNGCRAQLLSRDDLG